MDAILTWRNSNLQVRSASSDKEYIYGVSWNKTNPSSKLTRLGLAKEIGDSVPALGVSEGRSPFDTIYPWCDMTRVTIDGNEMVKIPKYYIKVENTDTTFSVKISPKPLTGYQVSPGHANRGDGKGERDFIYVSRYTLNSDYKSMSGTSNIVNITRATARAGIKNNNIAGFYQYDYLTYLTVAYLYLVEYANFNSQACIGFGHCDNVANATSHDIKPGDTNNMIYHTGTVGETKDDNAAVQYRYIENIWGNIRQFVDGIYFDATHTYLIKNPNNYSDTTGGTMLSLTRPTETGYIKNIGSDSTDPIIIGPTEIGGSKDTYVTDNFYCDSDTNPTNHVLSVGAGWAGKNAAGLFAFYCGLGPDESLESCGVRSVYLP